MAYKYKGLKISVNDKNEKIRLIIHTKKEGKAYYKTYFEREVDLTFINREAMINYLGIFMTKHFKKLKGEV